MFKKSKINKRVIVVVLTIFVLTALSEAQEDDPFYINLLNKGEISVLAGDYKQAVKDLEIACFGIKKNKKLKAKTCVYLGLCYIYLQDKIQGNKYFKKAEELLDPDGLNALDINEEVKHDLRRLSKAFSSDKEAQPIGSQILLPVPSERIPENESLNKEQLEQGIDRDPQKNIPVYYELYSLYRVENNFQEAKKTIEKLIENNPKEVFGYYLLGTILYQEREFDKAKVNFEEFFRLSANLDIKHETLTEAISFLILSLYYCGERDRAAQLIVASKGILSKESILKIQLSDKDKIILTDLFEENYR